MNDGTADSPAATVSITVTATAPTMHVGDLDATGGTSGKNWAATVTALVLDAGETPVAGATVTGTRGGGLTGSASCVTAANGRCSVSKSARKLPSVTFTVTNVTRSGATYASGTNHDPDGDSNGTTITVLKP